MSVVAVEVGLLIWLWLLPACVPDGETTAPTPPLPAACRAIGDTQRATPVGIKTAVDGCGELLLEDYRVLGEGELTLELYSDGVRVIPSIRSEADGAVFRALHLVGPATLAGDAPLRIWRQGYQSWSASGVFEIPELETGPEGLPVVGGDDGGLAVVEERAGTSWWAGLVGRQDGASVLVGALSAVQTKVAVAADPDGAVHVVYGGQGEAIPLRAGETLFLDPLYTAIGPDPNALWRRWADEVAAWNGVAVRAEPPTVGWATWYQYYEDVSEAQVRENLSTVAALAADPSLAPIGLFQIDDGWQVAWGDWRANDRFPSGTAALASEIADAGLVPGLWMAPFYVSRSTSTYADHPDWFVRGLDGQELEYAGNVVLDVTHPDAADWLSDQIAAKVAEGWTYLKLDFLYAGAEEGRRHLDVPGAVAYRLGIDLLRRAAGPDTWILACGAPLLPSVGFADSFRTGPDIAFSLDPDPRREYLRNQVRSTAARGFTNRRLWWVDADQLLVRDPFSPVDARGAVVATAVSGGAWLLGDSLADLPADRLALALRPEVVSLVGREVVPDAPLGWVSGFDTTPLLEIAQKDDRTPTRWVFEDGTVALLNLGDAPIEVDDPGGVDLLDGARRPTGRVTLQPGDGALVR